MRSTQRGALDTCGAHASSDGADRRKLPPPPVRRTRTVHAVLDARGAHASGRRPRRVAGGLNHWRGALTGTLTLRRWRDGVLTRGVLRRARTSEGPGPNPPRRTRGAGHVARPRPRSHCAPVAAHAPCATRSPARTRSDPRHRSRLDDSPRPRDSTRYRADSPRPRDSSHYRASSRHRSAALGPQPAHYTLSDDRAHAPAPPHFRCPRYARPTRSP